LAIVPGKFFAMFGQHHDSGRTGYDNVASMPHHQTASAGPDLTRLLEKAHAAHTEGALTQAEKFYKTILQWDPDNFDVLHCLGLLNFQSGRLAQALRFLSAALKRNARSTEALSNYGLVLHALGRTEEALTNYRAALAMDPDNADLLNKHGIALLDFGRPQEALKCLDRALALNPAHVEALGNRGNALVRLNRPIEAIASYDAMGRIEGDSGRLLTNRAHALRRLDRLEEALEDLHKAVALDPNYAEAKFELGMVQLALGNYDDGWTAYERRWATRAFVQHRRDFKSPPWTGNQAVNGRTILLHGEQGLGDTIQFVRYVTHVARLGATVILEVQPELVALLAETKGAAHVFARGEKPVPFDLHCPLMSLPLACKTNAVSIPANVPYIKLPEAQVEKWARRLPAGKPLVGFCWAGRRSHHNDANRSIALARFAPLFEIPNVRFISLQRDPSVEDCALLRGYHNVLDVEDGLRDFADSAALISQLDLVVSVDTAVAHLAGALAKPLVVLLPFAADFRWLRVRNDCPWYPSAKLFRQPRFDDWESVIEQVRIYLTRG
jgi:tetratricopeptide (TPR) repeat protein